MTAVRVVTDHDELENSGTVTHTQLDDYIDNAKWLLVTSSVGPVPQAARRLKAGSGITLTDSGAGGDLTVAAIVTSSLPSPHRMGELLFAVTAAEFVPALPITTITNGWLINNDGLMLVTTSSI